MRGAELVRVHDQTSPLRCLEKGADQIGERLAADSLHRGSVLNRHCLAWQSLPLSFTKTSSKCQRH